jgi:hypothetical protein
VPLWLSPFTSLHLLELTIIPLLLLLLLMLTMLTTCSFLRRQLSLKVKLAGRWRHHP